jgi:predicted secreted Zn-dependent protease
MAKKKGKSVSFDAMVKFFLQYYNIPTRNDIDKLMAKMDHLEMLIKSSLINGKGTAISGIQESKSKTSTGRTATTSTDSALEVIKRFRKGVAFADIQARTGFEGKKLRNIIYRLHKMGKIVRKSRGLYIAA